MNKTLIVLGAGIWGVMILLRFIVPTDVGFSKDVFITVLNGIEIVAFIITIAGILKRD